MIIVLDCGIGNTGSVVNMIRKIGVEAIASSDPLDLEKADKLILPGVGKFDHAMKQLQELDLIAPLHNLVLKSRKPILGICLGIQLFTRKSEEGILPGLGWIDAQSVRFNFADLGKDLKVPHMGWNSVTPSRNKEMFPQIDNELRYYFVHSYHVVCNDEQDILARTHYGYDFVSAIQKDNIWGVQFHPEKSHRYGMEFLRAFIERDNIVK